MNLLTLDHVSHSFGQTKALDDIGFTVAPGEIIGLIGRSGAGKSTLLRMLCGLDKPQNGSVFLEGHDITRMREADLVALRRRISFVFQHYNLLSRRTVAQNVALPLQIAGWPKARIATRVEELLELVGLSGHRDHRPSQLSGGQKQRVGIARALAPSPSLLLCDEATSALDPQTTTAILQLLKDINQRLNITIILITHEMDLVRQLAQRVLVLDAGRLIYDGPVYDLVAQDHTEAALTRLQADLQPAIPKALSARLRTHPRAGDAPIWRIVSIDDEHASTILSRIAAEHGVLATIIAGGITEYAAHPVTDMIVAFNAELPEAARQLIWTTAPQSKVLGHVPPHS